MFSGMYFTSKSTGNNIRSHKKIWILSLGQFTVVILQMTFISWIFMACGVMTNALLMTPASTISIKCDVKFETSVIITVAISGVILLLQWHWCELYNTTISNRWLCFNNLSTMHQRVKTTGHTIPRRSRTHSNATDEGSWDYLWLLKGIRVLLRNGFPEPFISCRRER